jgi:predicted PurR-regulated permease PerM
VTALDLAQEVLIPITLACLLSFVLAPIANLLRRLRLGRVPSVLLAVILALGVILAIGGLIGTQVAELVGEAPRYQHTIEQKIDTIRNVTIGRLSNVLRGIGHQIDSAAAPSNPASPQAGAPSAGSQAARPPMPVEVHQPDPSPFELAQRIVSPVVGPLSTTAIVFIVAIFILLQRDDLRDRMIRLFGSGDLHRTTGALNDAAGRLSRYFLAQLAINTGFGVIVGIGLLAIGVPSPVLWGILAALLRFLPYLGAPLAAVLPLALAAAVDPGWSMVLWTGALFVAVEGLTGQVIEPMLYSHSTGLSPVSVVVAATFWTWLWGPIGLIMSTPLTLCLVVLGRHVQRLEFLEVLLGDRPALTPVESFYQRMLAGDADGAHEQAETLLRQRSLSSYYDEVAVRGLRLASDDRLRGLLTDRQTLRIQSSFEVLLRDFDDQEDRDPEQKPQTDDAVGPSRAEMELPKSPAPSKFAPSREALAPVWQGDEAVLCVAGRGPLDEAAAQMLAQLLGKHGVGAAVLAHADVAPAKLMALDLSAVAMVCVCYLETSGTPSHVRYLIRRLRQRRRDVPILVGLWPAGEEVLENARHQATLGADHYVGTLRDAVDICVGAAIASVPPEQPSDIANTQGEKLEPVRG